MEVCGIDAEITFSDLAVGVMGHWAEEKTHLVEGSQAESWETCVPAQILTR